MICTRRVRLKLCSLFDSIGLSAWCQRESVRPSQNWNVLNAVLNTVLELRPVKLAASDVLPGTDVFRLSTKSSEGRWQREQEMVSIVPTGPFPSGGRALSACISGPEN